MFLSYPVRGILLYQPEQTKTKVKYHATKLRLSQHPEAFQPRGSRQPAAFFLEKSVHRRPTPDWDTHHVLKMHGIAHRNLPCLSPSKKHKIPCTPIRAGAEQQLPGSAAIPAPLSPRLPDSRMASLTDFTCLAAKQTPVPHRRNLREMGESAPQRPLWFERERGDPLMASFRL